MAGSIRKDKTYYFYEHALHDSYVYYKSLLTKKHPMARRVANAANDYLLGQYSRLNNSDDRNIKRINGAMEALKNAANNEAAKEKQFLEYINKKLEKNGITKLPDIIKDPYAFSKAVGELIKGTNQFQQELQLEIDRITELQHKDYGEKTSKEVHELLSKGELDKKFLHNLQNTIEGIGNDSSFTAFRAMTTQMSSLDGKIATAIITKYADKIFAIEGNNLVINGGQADIVIGLIITEIRERMLSETGGKTIDTATANKIIKQINKGKYRDIIDKYTNYTDAFLGTLDSIEKTLVDKKEYTNKTNKQIDNTIGVIRKRIRENQKQVGNINWGQNSDLEEQLESVIREMAHTGISFKTGLNYSGAEIISAAQLTQALGGQGVTSGFHTKDDIGVVTFECDLDEEGKRYFELRENFRKTIARMFDKYQFTTNKGTNYEKNYNTTKKTTEELSKILQQAADELGENILVLKELTNAFVIHGNVKSYDTIDTRTKGFSGGSIGANITQQLSNFANLLSYAGYGSTMTASDQNWFLTAVINSGRGLIGEANRDPLEKYLSSMVGLLLFDDAYLMAEESTGNMVETLTGTSMKQIHLYVLNGTYVPCSYVLQQTYQSLQSWRNNQPAVDNNGIKVKISTPGAKGTFPELNPNSWDEVKANAIANADISVSFMANFLGYLDTLNRALNP